MRVIYWILRAVLFVVLLAFALRNTDSVTVRAFMGREWQSPLVMVMCVFFLGGFLLGLAASLGFVARQRRAILGLKRELRARLRVAQGTARAA